MKNIFFILGLIFMTSGSFAQGTLGKGRTQLNAGVGLSSWGIPVYAGFDYGLDRDFTVGAEASFRSYRERFAGIYYRHGIMGLSGNVNYHFNRVLKIPSRWDFYGGLNVGFFVWNSPSAYDGSRSSGLGLGGQVGGRYFLSDVVGLNLEIGGGNAFSGGKLGLTIKL